MMDFGLAAKFIDINICIGRAVPYSLTFIKAYAASLSAILKNKVTVNLLAAREKTLSLKEKGVQKEAVSLLQGLRLDYRLASLGLLICIASFSFGLYHIRALRKELNKTVTTRLQVSVVNLGANYDELNTIDYEYKRKLGIIDNLIKKQLYVTELLDILPRALPKGVWLTSLSFKKEEDRAELSLEGMVYLVDGDSDKEFATLNQFVTNLKGNPEFSKYFREINITSLDRRQIGNLMTVNFFISCKIY
jgi:Tfp pilus assembly protein PilN